MGWGDGVQVPQQSNYSDCGLFLLRFVEVCTCPPRICGEACTPLPQRIQTTRGARTTQCVPTLACRSSPTSSPTIC
jgi:hypothetical protein